MTMTTKAKLQRLQRATLRLCGQAARVVQFNEQPREHVFSTKFKEVSQALDDLSPREVRENRTLIEWVHDQLGIAKDALSKHFGHRERLF